MGQKPKPNIEEIENLKSPREGPKEGGRQGVRAQGANESARQVSKYLWAA